MLHLSERQSVLRWVVTIDRDELAYLFDSTGVPSPDELAYHNAKLKAVAVAFAKWLDNNEGIAPSVLCAAVELTPSHVEAAILAAAAKRLEGSLETGIDESALSGLSTLAATPETRPIVAAHRSGLTRALRYTQLVADLKRLHDLVDQLRRSAYMPLRLLIDRFPNAGALVELGQYFSGLASLQRNLAEVAGSDSFAPDEHPWIEDHLNLALAHVKNALATRDAAPIVEAVGILKSIVETEMTGLDRELARAAQDLDLNTLVLQFREIQDEADGLGASPRDLLAMERDVGLLEEVSAALSTLVKEHGSWQRVDTYLNMFENTLNQSAAAMATPWTLVETRLRSLMQRGAAVSIVGLEQAVEDMAAAVALGDIYEIILKFPTLSTLVRDYFFRLDRLLLQECDRVCAIGEGLRAITERMDG